MPLITLKPGDIVATNSDTLLGWLIRKFSQVHGERGSQVNHVGIIVMGGSDRTALMVEALHFVRRHRLFQRYGDSDVGVRIWRHKHLTDDDRRVIARTAEGYVGRPYGYLKIAAHALDRWLFGGAYKVRKLFGYDRFPICSYVVAAAYHLALGYSFGVPVRQAQPDDIDDWCRAHPEDWVEITPLRPVTEWGRWIVRP